MLDFYAADKVAEERSEYKDTCYEIRETIFLFPDGMLGPFSFYNLTMWWRRWRKNNNIFVAQPECVQMKGKSDDKKVTKSIIFKYSLV